MTPSPSRDLVARGLIAAAALAAADERYLPIYSRLEQEYRLIEERGEMLARARSVASSVQRSVQHVVQHQARRTLTSRS